MAWKPIKLLAADQAEIQSTDEKQMTLQRPERQGRAGGEGRPQQRKQAGQPDPPEEL